MTGSNPTDRSKLGTKRHILTDRKGIPLSAVISSANTHDIKAVTDVIDNSVLKRKPSLSYFAKKKRTKQHHLCLDRAYNSKIIEKEIIKRAYVPHTPYKRKRVQQQQQNVKTSEKNNLYAKNKRWVVERTNSWHNRFRKLFIQYERKMENYLGLVQLSCSIIIYRKIVLG
jgi:putative transposase